MGADLVCYIAFGPRHIRINDDRARKVAVHARKYLDACLNAAQEVLLGRKDVRDPRQSPIEAKRSATFRLTDEGAGTARFGSLEELRKHPDYQALVKDILNDNDREVEAEHVFAAAVDDLIREVKAFVGHWNKPHFRDLSFRDDPLHKGRKVVVAGELSWGDEPEGGGYQMLKKAFGLGIAQRLGVS